MSRPEAQDPSATCAPSAPTPKQADEALMHMIDKAIACVEVCVKAHGTATNQKTNQERLKMIELRLSEAGVLSLRL